MQLQMEAIESLKSHLKAKLFVTLLRILFDKILDALWNVEEFKIEQFCWI